MAVFTVTNTDDSGVGSLRQAILDSNAAGGNNTIEFDPSLAGQTITILTTLPILASTLFEADINDDMMANDITIMMDQNASLFSLDEDGISAVNNFAVIDFDIDDTSFEFDDANHIIAVTADNISFSNTGIINTAGVETSFGDRGSSIRVFGDNFTLINDADASIVSAGRSVIESLRSTDDDFTTVMNAGLLEATDDTVRLSHGMVTNSGTIRTTGTFDFGGRSSIAGESADAIAIFAVTDEDYLGPVNHVINTSSGIIEGARSGVSLNTGGGIFDNAGIVTAEVTAIWGSGNPFGEIQQSDFIVNNSGTLIRTGENYGFGNPETSATITIFGQDLDRAIITNSGTIQSTDIAIYSDGIGITLNNQAEGIIISDSDGIDADDIGEDGVAFYAVRLEDFPFLATFADVSVSDFQSFENAQGITIDSDGNFVIPTIGTFATFGGRAPVVLVGADTPLLALIDLEATQEVGAVIWQLDATRRNIFPETINVTSSELGTLTVNFAIESGFTITDANGIPVYDVPQDIDFGDTIDNQGQINGDIITGLGDDNVINTGVIDGDISLGSGDDSFTSIGNNGGLSLNINGGDGDDVIQAGANDDVIDGGAGIDYVVYSGVQANYTVTMTTDGYTITSSTEGTDTLSNIEFARFSDGELALSVTNEVGPDDDTITGASSDDIIPGGAGNDTLNGGAGDDLLTGDSGRSLSLSSVEGQVFRAFQAVFDRAPDLGGFNAFVGEVRAGRLTQDDVITQFVDSEEFQLTFGSLGNEAFVRQLFLNVLDREGDAGGIAAFTAALDGGRARADVVSEFSNSPEFLQLMTLPSSAFATNVITHPAEGQVYRIYQAVFDRVPDAEGFGAFTNSIQAGTLTPTEITAQFVTSEEFQLTYGDLTTVEFVETLFTNVLPGNTDAAGRAAFTAALENGTLTRADVVAEFAESQELRNRTDDAAAEFVSTVFTNNMDVLDGGAGDDILFGGRGADSFVFDTQDGGMDTVLDFTSGTDTLDLGANADFDSFAEIMAAGSQAGQDTVFDFGDGNTLTLENVILSELTEADFGILMMG